VRAFTAKWLREYNEQRPHESLGDVPPVEYRRINLQNLQFRVDLKREGCISNATFFKVFDPLPTVVNGQGDFRIDQLSNVVFRPLFFFVYVRFGNTESGF
ncbi:MAG TPA: hypothetical protein EYH46_01530, partial [Sulfurivirga caldicuralii]|nr:hypothetical protein [Sulfurivirga caldicuralii]